VTLQVSREGLLAYRSCSRGPHVFSVPPYLQIAYPNTCAILVRRHGVYVWGPTWQKAKTMCEWSVTERVGCCAQRYAFSVSTVHRADMSSLPWCVSYDYLFEMYVRMRQAGLDPAAVPADSEYRDVRRVEGAK
jgi:hypothetical protein